MKNDAKTPTLYPAFVLLALFSLGGCLFKGSFPEAGKDPKSKPVRSAESIFREALP